jgi:predicted negative regulator of RcsB-dependent stress response
MNTTTNTSGETSGPKQGTSIDEALGQTELGSWISQNKAPVISALSLIVVGIFAYGIFNHFNSEKENKYADALHTVVSEKITPFQEDKLSAEELTKAFNSAWQEMGSFAGAAPYVIQVVDALTAKGKYQEAYSLITEADKRIENPQLNYFINVRAAVLAEDLGKKEEAISHLKKIVGSGVKYFEGKVYLDLGRLYLETGIRKRPRPVSNMSSMKVVRCNLKRWHAFIWMNSNNDYKFYESYPRFMSSYAHPRMWLL